MEFYDYIWQDYPDTVISTWEYLLFYQGGPIDHGTHVPGPVSQSSPESEYNAVCNSEMDLAHLRMLFHEFLNKDPDIVP